MTELDEHLLKMNKQIEGLIEGNNSLLRLIASTDERVDTLVAKVEALEKGVK